MAMAMDPMLITQRFSHLGCSLNASRLPSSHAHGVQNRYSKLKSCENRGFRDRFGHLVSIRRVGGRSLQLRDAGVGRVSADLRLGSKGSGKGGVWRSAEWVASKLSSDQLVEWHVDLTVLGLGVSFNVRCHHRSNAQLAIEIGRSFYGFALEAQGVASWLGFDYIRPFSGSLRLVQLKIDREAQHLYRNMPPRVDYNFVLNPSDSPASFCKQFAYLPSAFNVEIGCFGRLNSSIHGVDLFKRRRRTATCNSLWRGVIGCCTAYFLGKKGAKVTLVEKTEIACAASGKAGGFLALDWCDGSVVQGLARASFGLHAQLAHELDGERYGYRRVDTLSVTVEESRHSEHLPECAPKAGTPAWVDGGSIKGIPSVIGSKSTNAQVHPQLFTRAIFSEAQNKYGASLVKGEVQEVKMEGKKVTGVVVDGKLMAGDAVVLAMGPWSSRNPLISSLTSISGLKAHSIVLLPKDTNAISAHTLFLKYKTREGKSLDPEIYPRATGEVYLCGMSEEVEVPDNALQVLPRGESTVMLQRVAATVSSHFADAELTVTQACFLPCSEDNVPVIGKLPNLEGAYVGTGHSCWGILNAPATGAALAELIVDGVATTCSLKPFDPSRFLRIRSQSR